MKKSLVLVFVALFILISHAHSQSWTTVGSPGFSAGEAYPLRIAVSGNGTPYVAFVDSANGHRLTVMTYNGVSWENVGAAGFSDGRVAGGIAIITDGSGAPIVAYSDSVYGYRATVKKYNGTDWISIGAPNFTAGNADYASIALDSMGKPYVAFEDHLGKVCVMKYDASWSLVGSPDFSPGGAWFTSIAIDSNNVPYVAFMDQSASSGVTVMKFIAGAWSLVGSAGFTAHFSAYWPSLAIDNGGALYVCYFNTGDSEKVNVMKFDGADWVHVGAPDFAYGGISSIAINNAGIPFVAYSDLLNGYKATVRKFSGTDWVLVGNPGFSMGSAAWPSIAIDKSGTPYVGYTDYSAALKASVMKFKEPPSPISGAGTLCLDSVITLSDTTAGGYWSSSNPALIAVNAFTGTITGLAVGSATISYTAYDSTVVTTVNVDSCVTAEVSSLRKYASFLAIFPSPAHNFFNLYLSSPQNEKATIVITNMLGEKVRELSLETNTGTQIQLNAPQGVYFISAATKEGSMNEKIVIN